MWRAKLETWPGSSVCRVLRQYWEGPGVEPRFGPCTVSLYRCTWIKYKKVNQIKQILQFFVSIKLVFYLSIDVFTFTHSDTLLERWRKEGQLENILWNHVRSVLLKRHKHHHINSKQVKRHESRRQEVKQTLTLRHNGTMSCPDFLEASKSNKRIDHCIESSLCHFRTSNMHICFNAFP